MKASEVTDNDNGLRDEGPISLFLLDLNVMNQKDVFFA